MELSAGARRRMAMSGYDQYIRLSQVDAQALTPARTWVRYGGPDAAPVTTDGPLPETSDLVAGWYMIERAHPSAVRSVLDSSDAQPGAT